MEKRTRVDYHADEFPDISDTASACECTGLMPTPPRSRAQQEAYEKLFSMEVSQSEEETEGISC